MVNSSFEYELVIYYNEKKHYRGSRIINILIIFFTEFYNDIINNPNDTITWVECSKMKSPKRTYDKKIIKMQKGKTLYVADFQYDMNGYMYLLKTLIMQQTTSVLELLNHAP